MAKNKTIGVVTFNTKALEGVSRADFLKNHAGIYNKSFEGYPDQEERAQQQLEAAADILYPASEVKTSAPEKGNAESKKK